VKVAGWLRLPATAVTVTVVVPFGVVAPPPPPPLLLLLPPQPDIAIPSAAISVSPNIHPFQLRRKRTSPLRPRRTRDSSVPVDPRVVRPVNGAGCVSDAVATSVATVSVVEATLVPFGVTVAGEKVQVLLAGSPEQEKLTCWLKPSAGVTLTVVFPDVPAVTVTVVGLKLTVKLGVPTVCVRAVDVDPVKFVSPP